MSDRNPNQPQIDADERRYKRPNVRRFAFDNERKKISAHLRESAARNLA